MQGLSLDIRKWCFLLGVPVSGSNLSTQAHARGECSQQVHVPENACQPRDSQPLT